MLDFKISANRTHVKANSNSVVFAAIDLLADQSTIVQRRGLNICLAIDCSGSMQGIKIEQAKDSAIILARSLSPNDLISIVTFEGKVRVELAPTYASEQIKIESVVRSIKIGGSTKLYGGLEKAHELIKNNSRAGAVSRIVVITDGIPTDKENPRDYEKLCNTIRSEGITVSPIGIGDDYNEVILLKISDSGGGEWMHVTDPQSQLPNFLREQVTMMSKTIAVNPELKLKILPGAEIVNLYAVKPILTEMQLPERHGDEYSIHIRDVVAEQEQTIVFRIKVPSKPNGNFTLVSAKIMNSAHDLPIAYSDNPSFYNAEPNPSPRILLFATEGTVLMRKGIGGDTMALKQAETIIKTIPSDPQATIILSRTTQDTLNNLQQIHEQTVMRPNLSESEKKQALHDTTIIRRKSNSG
ncbi:MAG: vWA domain-containing protein [Nitrosopumilaceae archaeon]